MPMHPDHSWACVVAYHDREAGGPRFRRYKGMLFGLPLAVSAFNRLPMFLQSACRRLLRSLFSMYFEDLTLQDWGVLLPRPNLKWSSYSSCLASLSQPRSSRSQRHLVIPWADA